MYPTTEEKETLRKWMGTVRWTYNKALSMMQDDGISDMKIITRHYLNDEGIMNNELSWVKQTP
ncbi:13401_t:CDS:1, partial [Gigaspora rosea]